MTYKYGIDFGTTNTSVAVALPGKDGRYRPNLLMLDPESVWGPSEFLRTVFYIDVFGGIHIGSGAVRALEKEIQNNTFSADRYVTQLKMGLSNADLRSTCYNPQNLIAAIFQTLKKRADKFAADNMISFKGVVIGVPVSFSDENKQLYLNALCQAGYYASFEDAVNETEFVSEPVAVAVHYGEKLTENKRVMVFDYGGGTLDIAVLDLREQIGKNDKLHPHDVLGKSTGYNIAGERINKEFFIHFIAEEYGIQKIKSFLGINDSRINSAEALWNSMHGTGDGEKFYERVDRCKRELSKSDTALFLPPRITKPGCNLDNLKVTRSEFEDAVMPVFREIDKVVDNCLKDCKNHKDKYGKPDPVLPEQISEVLLAGGSSLIPKVKDILAKHFDRSIIGKNTEGRLLEEDEVLGSIVRGMSIIGCKNMDQKTGCVSDILECSYGIMDEEKHQFDEIIPKGTRLSEIATDDFDDQAGKSQTYTTISSNASEVRIRIMQKTGGINNEFEKQIKEVRFPINEKYGNRFTIFMSVDRKTKMLVLKVYIVKLKKFVMLSREDAYIRINL